MFQNVKFISTSAEHWQLLPITFHVLSQLTKSKMVKGVNALIIKKSQQRSNPFLLNELQYGHFHSTEFIIVIYSMVLILPYLL